jgi:pre-60S factor REI1
MATNATATIQEQQHLESGVSPVQSSGIELTSTTAPGKIFTSRAELALHYKTPWHKYNLKRREASLPPLLETDFLTRLAAAQDVHNERSMRQQSGMDHNGKGHLKSGKRHRNTTSTTTSRDGTSASVGVSDSASTAPKQAVANGSIVPTNQEADNSLVVVTTKNQRPIEINPKQCLFDRHVSATVQTNVDRMHRKYGFFIPDYEYLTDMTGLVGYCHEKIQLGNVCLYCHRTFRTARSCIQHMHNKVHTKLRYELGIDLEDLDVFYDFTEANEDFLNGTVHPKLQGPAMTSDNEACDDVSEEPDNSDEEGVDEEWEDVSEDENENDDDEESYDGMNDDDDDLYRGYEDEVAKMGWKVTPLGELIFPDGRIIGHRGLRRYYKQRLSQSKQASVAVSAARQAAGERLYRGRVYNIGNNGSVVTCDNESSHMSRALAICGISPGSAAGRAGNGILVTNTSGTYSQISVYRYKAALRKQRTQMRQGQQIIQRTKTNMNRMDKKANRLMNNVSVAHAQR